MDNAHPVPLSGDLAAAGRLMRLASLASISVALTLSVAKAAAWLATDSVAMLSSLIDSALDLVSSAITFLAIHHAVQPADREHRFGHGKAEALAGVAQAGFIAASAGGLLLTVIDRYLHPRALQSELVGVAVSTVAVLLTLCLMALQGFVVRRTGSLAVAADRAHYTTDLVTNVVVGIGLVAATTLQQPLIDLGVALGVAIYLVIGARSIGRTAIDVLMDRELPDSDRRRILSIVTSHPAVRSAHDLRTRSAGLTKFIQLHVVLEPTMSLGRAHVIGDSIQGEILQAFPDAEVILHVDPWNDAEPRVAKD